MTGTNGDILPPIPVHQNSPHPLFDRCRQMGHLHGRESLLHVLKTRDRAVATSEIILQCLGQARAEVGVAAVA